MKEIQACTLEEIKTALKKVIEVESQPILIIYHNDKVYAVDNVCPHAKGHLNEGRVEDGTLTCINHGTCFDLETGKVRIDRIDEELAELFEDEDDLPFGPLPTFPVRIENEMVIIEV